MQFTAEDSTNGELLVEVKSVNNIRPRLEDDSQKVPLTSRQCGDAVDVSKDGCWWTGRVCQCYTDHITVMFPNAPTVEEPYQVWRPPHEPDLYRARTAKHYNAQLGSWEKLPKVWYPQCEDHRNQQPAPTSMLPQQSKVKHRRAIVLQEHSSGTSSSQLLNGQSGDQSNAKGPTGTPTRAHGPKYGNGVASHTGAYAQASNHTTKPRSKQGQHMLELLEDDILPTTKAHISGQSYLMKTRRLDHAQPGKTMQGTLHDDSLPRHDLSADVQHDDNLGGSDPSKVVQAQHLAKSLVSARRPSSTYGASMEQDDGKVIKQNHKQVVVQPCMPSRQLGTHAMNAEMQKGKVQAKSGVLHRALPSKQTIEEPTISGDLQARSMLSLASRDDDVITRQPTCSILNPASSGGSAKPRQLPAAALFLRGDVKREDSVLESTQSTLKVASIDHVNTPPVQSLQLGLDGDAIDNGLTSNNAVLATKQASKRCRSVKQDSMNVAKKRQRLLAQASKTRHVLCVDFLGVQFEAKQLESQLGELLDGIHGIRLGNVPLEAGNYVGGWAAIHFDGEEEAQVALQRLQSLCMQRHGFPFPMPLLVHPPHMTKYPWGVEPYPPGCVTKVGTCHFMQPNSLEFGSAQEWRALELFVLDKKDAMLRSHEEELASVLQAYAEEAGIATVAQTVPPPPPLPTSQLWLKGLTPKHVAVDDVTTAFCQWIGDGGMHDRGKAAVDLLTDPVTGDFTGHALVQMQSIAQAVWVMSD